MNNKILPIAVHGTYPLANNGDECNHSERTVDIVPPKFNTFNTQSTHFKVTNKTNSKNIQKSIKYTMQSEINNNVSVTTNHRLNNQRERQFLDQQDIEEICKYFKVSNKTLKTVQNESKMQTNFNDNVSVKTNQISSDRRVRRPLEDREVVNPVSSYTTNGIKFTIHRTLIDEDTIYPKNFLSKNDKFDTSKRHIQPNDYKSAGSVRRHWYTASQRKSPALNLKGKLQGDFKKHAPRQLPPSTFSVTSDKKEETYYAQHPSYQLAQRIKLVSDPIKIKQMILDFVYEPLLTADENNQLVQRYENSLTMILEGTHVWSGFDLVAVGKHVESDSDDDDEDCFSYQSCGTNYRTEDEEIDALIESLDAPTEVTSVEPKIPKVPVITKPVHAKKRREQPLEELVEPTELPANFYMPLPLVPITTRIAHQGKRTFANKFNKVIPQNATISSDYKHVAIKGKVAPLFNCALHRDRAETCDICDPNLYFKPTSYLIDYQRLAMYSKRKNWHTTTMTKIQTQSLTTLLTEGISLITQKVKQFFEKFGETFVSFIIELTFAEDYSDLEDAFQELLGELPGKIVTHILSSGYVLSNIASLIYDFITDLRPWNMMNIMSYLVRGISLILSCGSLAREKCVMLYEAFMKRIPVTKLFPSCGKMWDDQYASSLFSRQFKATTKTVDDQAFREKIEAPTNINTEGNMSGGGFWDKIATVLRIFNSFATASKTISAFAQYISKLLPTFITEWFSQVTPERKWDDYSNDKSSTWYDFMRLSLAIDLLIDDGIDAGMLAAWHESRRKVESFVTNNRNYMGRDAKSFYDKYSKRFLDVEPKPLSNRMEPLTIYIQGASRIGKSACVGQLVTNIFGGDNPYDYIYTRNVLTKNWDGYDPRKHKALLYDEFGAIDSAVEGYTEVKELIPLVSPSVYVCPMASLDSNTVGKKGTRFTSPMIVMLSNMAPPRSDEIKCSEAYHNRIHFQVTAARKFQDHTAKSYMAMDFINFTHLYFTLHKVPRGFCRCRDQQRELLCNICTLPTTRVVSFHELCDLYSFELAVRTQAFAETDRDMNYFNTYQKRDTSFLLRTLKKPTCVVSRSSSISSGTSTIADDAESQITAIKTEGWATDLVSHPAALSSAYYILSVFGITDSVLKLPNYVTAYSLTKNMWYALGAMLEVVQIGAYGYIGVVSASNIIEAIISKFGSKDFATESFETIVKPTRKNKLVHMSTQAALLRAGNIVRFELTWMDIDGSPITVGQNALISGKRLLTTAHSFKDMTFPASMTILPHADASIEPIAYPITEAMMFFFEGRDLMRVDLITTTLPTAKSLKSAMYDDAIVDKKSFRGVMIALRKESSENLVAVSNCQYQTRDLYDERRQETFLNKSVETITGAFPTRDGDCGAPIVNSNTKIVGIHFGASSYDTFAVPITFRDFGIDTKGSPLVLHSTVHKWCINKPLIKSLGSVSQDQIHFLNTKSKIIKSPIFGAITTSRVAPAVLSPHDVRNKSGHSPLVLAISKYDVDSYVLPHNDLEEAREFLRSKWYLSNEVPYRVLTVDEVLNGSSLPYCNGMNMATSAGFGYPTSPNGKRMLFNFSDRYTIDSPLLMEKLQNLENIFKKGDIETQLVVDCLKDETRSLEKIEKGKTRLFNIFPVHYNILVLKYFGSAVEHMISLFPVENTIFAIGMNPYSTQWDTFVRKHLSMSNLCFDGDGASFDAQFNTRQVMSSTLQMIIDWALVSIHPSEREQHAKTMRAIFWSGVEVDHIAGNFAYRTQQGVQSGWPLTTLVNSCTISQLIYMAYQSSVPAELANPVDFCDNVAITVFGDDHVVSPSNNVAEYFNFVTTKAYMESLGLTYTSGLKSEEERKLWPLLNTTFLKNTIGRKGPLYVALLAAESIFEMLNWITVNGDPWELLSDNVRTAQRFLYFYDECKFEAFSQKIKSIAAHIPLLSYSYLNQQFISNGAWKGFTPFLFARKHVLLDRENVINLVSPTNKNLLTPKMNTKIEDNAIVTNSQTSIKTQAEILAGLAMKALPHVLETAGSVLGLSLDMPTDPTERTRKTRCGPLNNTKGVFPASILRNVTSAMTATDDQHFKEDSAMSIADIISIPSNIIQAQDRYLWTQFPTWSTSDIAGAPLFFVKVGPGAEYADNSAQYITDYGIPSIFTYGCTPFSDWSGSILYEIEVFASKGFHTGALRVGFHPRVYDPSNLNSVSENTSQYFADLNLAEGTKKIVVSVPFIAPYSTLKVCNSNNVSNADAMKHFFTGLLYITVAKKLVVSGVAASTVEFRVRVAAGQDFKLYNGNNHNQSIWYDHVLNAVEETPFVTQSDVQKSTSKKSTTSSLETEQKSVAVGGTTVSQGVNMSTTATRKHTKKRSTTRGMKSIPETPWSMRDTRSKMLQFDNVTWTSAPTGGTIVKAWNVPQDLQPCSLSKIGSERFTFQNYANIHIRALVSGSAFESGALRLVYVPLVSGTHFSTNTISPFIDSAVQSDILQGITLSPHTEKSSDLILPFRHPQERLVESLGDTLGVLVLHVLSPLTAAAGNVNDVDISMFSTFEGAEIYTPLPCNEAPTMDMITHSAMTSIRTQSEVMEVLNMVQEPAQDQSQIEEELVQEPFEQKETLPEVPFEPSKPEASAIHLSKSPNRGLELPKFTPKDVAHFEDTTQNIMELTKKFYPVFVTNIKAESTPQILKIPIANLMFQSEINRGGMFAHFGNLFRAYRGDLRFKIVFQAIDLKDGEVVDLHVVLSVDNERVENFNIANTDDLTILNAGMSENSPATGRNCNVTRAIICNANQEVLNVEVPYTATGNFVIPSAYITFRDPAAPEPYRLGNLNIVYASDNKDIDYRVTVYGANGDAGAFGMLWRVPRVSIRSDFWPDDWIGSRAGVTVEQKSRKQRSNSCESEFTVVSVQDRRASESVPNPLFRKAVRSRK